LARSFWQPSPWRRPPSVSHQWRGSTLTLKLDDGAAELEWISGVAFRFTRTWGEQADRCRRFFTTRPRSTWKRGPIRSS
jgi:hypothetical protein